MKMAMTALNGNTHLVQWNHDGVYRLTNESITNAPGSKNGKVGYGLDPVGNRQTAVSSIPGLNPSAGTFNQDDELASSENYDAKCNVTAAGGKTFSYDSENRLVSMNGGTATFLYNGDGNRVAKSVNGVVTRYLVDTYGLQRLSQN